MKDGAHGLLAEHYEEVNHVLYKHIESANQLTSDQRRQQQQHYITSLTTTSCTHHHTCTYQLISNAIRGYLAGFVFRVLFHNYMNNAGGRSRLQQSRSFGLIIASIRVLYIITTCTYHQYQFQSAVRSEPTIKHIKLPNNITLNKMFVFFTAVTLLRHHLKLIV